MRIMKVPGAAGLALAAALGSSALGCGSDTDTDSPSAKGTGGISAAFQGRGTGGMGSHATGGSGATQPPQPDAAVATGASGGSAPKDAGTKPDAALQPATDAGAAGAAGAASRSALRVTELYLRDPHFYANGVDITDKPLLGNSVNGSLIPNGLSMDYDNDGFIDTSFLLVFQPLDPSAAHGALQLISGNCKLSDPTHCEPKGAPSASWTIDGKSAGTCLEAASGTTSSFKPAVATPSAPCFVTNEGMDITVTLGGIQVPLTAARLAATYQGSPVNALMSGLIAGFLTKQRAMQTSLPDYLGPPLAGTPLSDYLDAKEADMAASPNGEDGFWVYLNFVAKPVTYVEK